MAEKFRINGVLKEVINYGVWQEVFFSSDFGAGKNIKEFFPVYKRLAALIQDEYDGVINEKIYCSRNVFEDITESHEKIWHDWQGKGKKHGFCCLEGASLGGGEVAGFQIRAFKLLDGSSCITDFTINKDDAVFLLDWGKYKICYLTGFQGRSTNGALQVQRELNTHRLITQIFYIVLQHGFERQDVVRTWFYLDKIGEWYGSFNKVRRGVFENIGLGYHTHELLPASTGIGIYSGKGVVITAEAIAVKSASSQRIVRVLHNPIQKEAYEYGSLFSRGVSVDFGSSKVVYVSGTASIGEKGESLYPKNPEKQIERTFKNIETLISSEGCALSDIKQATVYFKEPQDYETYRKICGQRINKEVPQVCMLAEICRAELQFEMEAIFSIART